MAFKKTPTAKTPVSADDFVSAAGQPVVVDSAMLFEPPVSYPWEGKRNDKRTELYNLRLTEEEKAKLQYIADNTKYSIQSFIRENLMPIIDAEVEKLIK
jgi:hypothetical protein